MHYETNRYSIEILLNNKNDLISFDTCFEFNMPKILPKVFQIRDDRVFTKYKLSVFDNTVIRIICKGRVQFSDLKAHLPTVFDIKTIKRLNEKEFINRNKKYLVELSKEIIGEDKAENIINKKT